MNSLITSSLYVTKTSGEQMDSGASLMEVARGGAGQDYFFKIEATVLLSPAEGSLHIYGSFRVGGIRVAATNTTTNN